MPMAVTGPCSLPAAAYCSWWWVKYWQDGRPTAYSGASLSALLPPKPSRLNSANVSSSLLCEMGPGGSGCLEGSSGAWVVLGFSNGSAWEPLQVLAGRSPTPCSFCTVRTPHGQPTIVITPLSNLRLVGNE